MDRDDRYARLRELPFRVVDRNGKLRTQGFILAAADVIRHRSMLNLLVRRDLKSRYKDSALGFVWTLVRPITQLVIYAVVIGKFLGAERGIPLFAVYIFTGLTIFTLFQEIMAGGTGSILANAGLVKKVYVPRELFPLAATGTALFNFVIQFVVLLVASAIFSNSRFSTDVLYAIPAVLVVVSYGVALALLLSAVNVYLRDIGYLVEIVAMVLMWASPILYSWSMVKQTLNSAGLDWLLNIYTNNPITLAVLGFQKAIYGTADHGLEVPENLLTHLLIALAIGLVLIVLCQRVFGRLQGNFAQEL